MNIDKINSFHSKYIVDAYEYFGSFFKGESTLFRLYAPHAEKVSVVGDFNSWDDSINIMTYIDNGIWEIEIPNVKIYDNYKYSIYSNNHHFLKQDPYAKHSETNGASSSKVFSIDGYVWNDSEWMKKRTERDIYSEPVNIYEVHLGSWKKHKKGYNLNYRVIADKLIPYVKRMGYNYIELMPITEYPFEGSWGYQVTGYFSPTSRYGTPIDFMYLIDKAHINGIGVIMDWVPAHFPKDDYGLYEFDGQCLYEDPAPTRKEHTSWGTRIFNYGKPEVKSFLLSSANLFFDKYHIDGLRVDAVAAMIYLDYDRKEWVPNVYGGNYHLEAIDFLKTLNSEMFYRYGNILMIAEESTAFPKVTYPVSHGGLGFNFKWCMGWMNDSLSYMSINPLFKKYDHNKMTFAMSYVFSENFILPLSHDEVVHGKYSMINKMPGEYDDKFANLRTYYMYMMTHVGKKLTFMGNEFGQFIEWDEKKELDWFLLDYPMHNYLLEYVRKLNHIYLKTPNLYENEKNWDGFNWIYADDDNNNCYVYQREAKNKKDLIVILNFSGCDLINYKITSKSLKGTYKVLINSNDTSYGGSGAYSFSEIKTIKGEITLSIPKFTGIILKHK